jgi:DNA replication protein
MEQAKAKATPRQAEFLLEVLEAELELREERKRAALLKRSRLPMIKSLEDYDWSNIRLPQGVTIDSLCQCAFVMQKRNLVLYGSVGTGKTHLAMALGLLACEQGLEVRFYSVAGVALKMAEALKLGTLESFMKDIRKADLLILDEWGYLPLDRESAQLLFRLVAESYEQRSIVLTTNLEFSKWGGIFMDDQMTAAIIDRLAHHGHLVVFEGESYRMKHALMKQRA